MSENFSERIENALNDIKNAQSLFKLRYGEECIADKEIEEVLKMAKAEHEEIQQYRAIGTVEEFKTLKENASSGFEIDMMTAFAEKLGEYIKIGTLDECRAAMEKQNLKKPYITKRKVVFVGFINVLRVSGKLKLTSGTGIALIADSAFIWSVIPNENLQPRQTTPKGALRIAKEIT